MIERKIVGWHRSICKGDEYDRDGDAQPIFADSQPHNKISWGEPAQVCEAKMDKHCPCCERTRADGFDMLFIGGDLVGAKCDDDEWSYGKDVPQSAPTLSSLKNKNRPADNRRSAAKRGYDRRWRRVRLAKLTKDPICEICKVEGRVTVATDVHHKDENPRNNRIENLQSTCHRHHSQITAKSTKNKR